MALIDWQTMAGSIVSAYGAQFAYTQFAVSRNAATGDETSRSSTSYNVQAYIGSDVTMFESPELTEKLDAMAMMLPSTFTPNVGDQIVDLSGRKLIVCDWQSQDVNGSPVIYMLALKSD